MGTPILSSPEYELEISGCCLIVKDENGNWFDLLQLGEIEVSRLHRDGAAYDIVQVGPYEVDSASIDGGAIGITTAQLMTAHCDCTSGGAAGGGATDANATVTLTSETTAGSVAAGAYQVGFTNVGAANALVEGAAFPPGASVTYTGYHDVAQSIFYRLESITYDGTGTTLLVSVTQ